MSDAISIKLTTEMEDGDDLKSAGSHYDPPDHFNQTDHKDRATQCQWHCSPILPGKLSTLPLFTGLSQLTVPVASLGIKTLRANETFRTRPASGCNRRTGCCYLAEIIFPKPDSASCAPQAGGAPGGGGMGGAAAIASASACTCSGKNFWRERYSSGVMKEA